MGKNLTNRQINTINPGQNETGNNGNEGIFHPQFRTTASPSIMRHMKNKRTILTK